MGSKELRNRHLSHKEMRRTYILSSPRQIVIEEVKQEKSPTAIEPYHIGAEFKLVRRLNSVRLSKALLRLHPMERTARVFFPLCHSDLQNMLKDRMEREGTPLTPKQWEKAFCHASFPKGSLNVCITCR